MRGFSNIVNTTLGAGAMPYPIADLDVTTFDVNGLFLDGVPSPFTHEHLVDGACL